jgi:hypothetical protein
MRVLQRLLVCWKFPPRLITRRTVVDDHVEAAAERLLANDDDWRV